jgi:preprotein translocase subunit SecG
LGRALGGFDSSPSAMAQGPTRFTALLVAVFAATALMLGAIAVSGVLALMERP